MKAVLTTALVVGLVKLQDQCSSSKFPFVFGAPDSTTTVTCLTALDVDENTLVVAGSTSSSSFSTSGGPYPYVIFLDSSDASLGTYKSYMTSATASFTTFQGCSGC